MIDEPEPESSRSLPVCGALSVAVPMLCICIPFCARLFDRSNGSFALLIATDSGIIGGIFGVIIGLVLATGANARRERNAAAAAGMAFFATPILVLAGFTLFSYFSPAGVPVTTPASGAHAANSQNSFHGLTAGEQRSVLELPLCWCPAGEFVMGSPPSEPDRRPDEDQVKVTLTRGFWIAKYETTQGQWKRVAGELPGEFTVELPEDDDLPVGNVNFAEAESFCRKLTALSREAGELPGDWEFRLPTEAQWEYACRAGTTTATAFGDKLSSRQANFKGRPYNGAKPAPVLGRAAKVGSYPANAWKIYDMHGNSFEWCRDWYHAELPGGVDPDLYLAKATSRVRRGGCWADDGWPCRSAFRLRFEPERRYDHIGFRVVAVHMP